MSIQIKKEADQKCHGDQRSGGKEEKAGEGTGWLEWADDDCRREGQGIWALGGSGGMRPG